MQTKVKRKGRPPFSGRRVPLPRPLAWSRLVPTSHAAGEPSPAPLVWTRRSTTGRTATPPVRVSSNRPRRATSVGTSEEEGSASQKERMNREERRASETRRERASCVSALYRAGIRPSLRPVSGSTSLLEASQKGAFLTPDSVTPRVHQLGASHPTPPPSHSSEKTGGKNPRASRNSSSFLSRSVLVIVVVGGRWV